MNQFEKELIKTLEVLANIPIEILTFANSRWKGYITAGDIKKAREIIKILKTETKNRR